MGLPAAARMLQEASASAAADTSASASASASVAAQTAWPIEVFVQPDPRAATVDSSVTATALGSAEALAAVNAVTSTDYGAPTVVAAAIAEVAVAWDQTPTGTSGDKSIKIAGSMTAAGYVYCMQTDAPARMLQEASASAAEASASAEGSASGEASAEKPAGKEYPTMRKEVTADNLKFEMTMTGLAEGADIHWSCMGTSLNPNMKKAKHMTAKATGMTKTNPAPAPPAPVASESDAGSALMSSLFAAIIMIAAVFFY